VRDAAEIEHAIDRFAREPSGDLIVLPSGPTIVHRNLIIALASPMTMSANPTIANPFTTSPQSGSICFTSPV
jgi:hypothetical protein